MFSCVGLFSLCLSLFYLHFPPGGKKERERGIQGGGGGNIKLPLRHNPITLLPDFPDADLHPVLCDHDVLLLHLLARFVGDVVADAVDDVADEAEDGEDGEEDEEGCEGVHFFVARRGRERE